MAIKLLLDTNGYAAFKKGQPEVIEIIKQATLIGLNSIILGELLGGFRVGQREVQNRAELKLFLASPRVQIFPITMSTAEQYAQVYAELRQKGRPIPTNDMWIAASALEHDVRLLTFDHHFSQITGLKMGQQVVDFE